MLQRVGHILVDTLAAHPLARRVRWSVDVDPLDYS
jgi:hypothetical protein